jgi:toxin ParE1/3/4
LIGINKRPEVIFDVAEIYAWILSRNPEAAERFLKEVDASFEQIRQQPGIGWERRWKNPRLEGIRSWRISEFPNFLIFYREVGKLIDVYAVLRGARDLERTLRRRS